MAKSSKPTHVQTHSLTIDCDLPKSKKGGVRYNPGSINEAIYAAARLSVHNENKVIYIVPTSNGWTISYDARDIKFVQYFKVEGRQIEGYKRNFE